MAEPRPNRILQQFIDEHGFTHEALAAKVCSAAERLGAPVACSARHVRRWLAGQVTWPRSRSRQALESLAGRPAEDLGFVRPTPVVAAAAARPEAERQTEPQSAALEMQSLLRRQFALASAGMAIGVALPPLPTSGRLGMTDVDRIRETAARLHALDDVHGGATLVDVTDRYIKHVQSCMWQCTYGPNVERRLYRTLGELHASAGWFAYDAGMHDVAARSWDAALRNALLARDSHLQTRIWSYMALQASVLRRGGDAVAISRAALDMTRNGRDPRLSALLHARVALGYATLGEPARCGQSLNRAEAAFNQVGGQAPPSWLAFCGPDELTAQAAICHNKLGKHGRAVELRRAAIDLRPSRFQRNQFVGTVHLAECLLADGEPEEAVAAGDRALSMLPAVRSPRGGKRLARFRQGLAGLESGAVREFTERYDATQPRGRENR